MADNTKDIDVVMPMYNVIEYSNNYSKTSGSLWQYYTDEQALVNGVIVHFPADNNNSAFLIYLNKKQQAKQIIMQARRKRGGQGVLQPSPQIFAKFHVFMN